MTAEEVTRSWLSAVDIIAARIAERTTPASSAGSSDDDRNIKIFSESPIAWNCALRASFPGALRKDIPKMPTRTAAARVTKTQIVAIMRDFLIISLDFIAIKRTKMCGIPK